MDNHTECVKRNKEIGLKYLKLSQDTKALSERFREKQINPIKGMNWDLPKIISLYDELYKRFEVIGNRLVKIE